MQENENNEKENERTENQTIYDTNNETKGNNLDKRNEMKPTTVKTHGCESCFIFYTDYIFLFTHLGRVKLGSQVYSLTQR